MDIKPSVFIAHFTTFLENNEISEDHKTLIELVVACVQGGMHPLNMVSSEAVSVFKQITNIDLSKLTLEGIHTPETKNNVIKKKKKITVNSDPLIDLDSIFSSIAQISSPQSTETTACIHYSCAQNLSSHYAYANEIDSPTCSHKSAPHGLYCPYGISQSKCTSFVPDERTEQFNVDDSSYKIVYTRTIQGMMNVNMFDEQENHIHTLSYYVNDFNELSQEDIHQEFSSILTDHHLSKNAKDFVATHEFIKNQELSQSKTSYISTLIS